MNENNADLKFQILQLGKVERDDLLQQEYGLFESENATLPAGSKGELLTAALVAWLTKAAVVAFVNWLLRRMDTTTVQQEIVIERPDGSKLRLTVVVTSRDPKKAQDQVLEQINKKLLEFGHPPLAD